MRETYTREQDVDKIDGIPNELGVAGVLEVLVALACRIDDEYMWDGQSYAGIFLMDMLSNLRLLKIDGFDSSKSVGNRNFNTYGTGAIRDILGYWLNREFDYDGYGSPFPLQNPLVDQRNVQIWDQAIAYVGEHFR